MIFIFPAAFIAIPLVIGAAIYLPWRIFRGRRAHPTAFALAVACVVWAVSDSVLGAIVALGVAYRIARSDQGQTPE